MKEFLKNNARELGISLILGYFLYLVIMKIFNLSLVCPPDQAGRCILFGWLMFLVLLMVSSAFIFGIILLAKYLVKKLSKK